MINGEFYFVKNEVFKVKDKDKILEKVNNLVLAYKEGVLGGEKMPEDENPHLDKKKNLKIFNNLLKYVYPYY